jgi:hypothetical protein
MLFVRVKFQTNGCIFLAMKVLCIRWLSRNDFNSFIISHIAIVSFISPYSFCLSKLDSKALLQSVPQNLRGA